MNEVRKICVVTGSRADYGLLYPVLRCLRDSNVFDLQIIATGMHLSPEFGETYRVIEKDGFEVSEKVEMLLSSDTDVGVAKSIGLGVIGFAETLKRVNPNLLVVLGDRFEILAAAQAAMVERIPMAHLFGGDTTEGAFDEMIRHCLTKMAHIHFVTNEDSRRRVCQMGENPQMVFNVGSPGLDVVKNLDYLSREALAQDLEIEFEEKNLLITYHPSTLDRQSTEGQVEALFAALEMLELRNKSLAVFFTRSNADTEGRAVGKLIADFARRGDNRHDFVSLGQLRYLSLMRVCDIVVGNSSSGLYEAPSLGVPTVNIGDRQKGRLRASSVVDCPPEKDKIYEALEGAFSMDCSEAKNPYGDGRSGPRIVDHLARIESYDCLLQKRFYNFSEV